jgi:hypothetical protein
VGQLILGRLGNKNNNREHEFGPLSSHLNTKMVPDAASLELEASAASHRNTGLPDLSSSDISKWENMYQITTRYAKWRQNTPYM